MDITTQVSTSRSHGGTFFSERPFAFECGATLPGLRVAYESWGCLNSTRDNAILVVHALTGDAHAASSGSSDDSRPGWWEGLIGPGKALDPDHHFIVCSNLLGGCYGTSGPSDPHPRTGRPCGPDFPTVTTRDMARAQRTLLDHLGVKGLTMILGGSLGAMVTWEFLIEYPGFARAAVPMAGGTSTSPWAIAFDAVARQAILGDPGWQGGRYVGPGPVGGLALARQLAMTTYRTDRLFQERFGRDRADADPARSLDPDNLFQVERYLRNQGEKLVRRFDARTYLALTAAMDLHDVARGRGGLEAALSAIEGKVLCVGIDTDALFPAREMQKAADLLLDLGKGATYAEIASPFGHDAFLVEYDQLGPLVAGALDGDTP
jgi:homoserine O-acetyltransferase/O-succinyltransferase